MSKIKTLWTVSLFSGLTWAASAQPPAEGWRAVFGPKAHQTADGRYVVWAGILNDTASMKIVCVTLSPRYEVLMADGTIVGRQTGPVPYACESEHDAVLVMPGERLLRPVELAVLPTEKRPVELTLEVWELEDLPPFRKKREVTVRGHISR